MNFWIEGALYRLCLGLIVIILLSAIAGTILFVGWQTVMAVLVLLAAAWLVGAVIEGVRW